jgi:serine/threonine protein kinase
MKTHVGHYEIVAELGRGGMGVVYKGYEPSLARNVAIKELSAALAHDGLVVERFLREARSMAMLNDPHIIQIYSIGQENDQPFFVMEFVDGVSVAALINRDGKLSSGDALKILRQTAQGLGAAHDRGVIHRDVKPANLMISQRAQVKIADFGIALANHEVDAKLTSQGELVGTPGYLSPELLLGNPVDERSDVYALGIVLFEMLIGRTPFSEVSVYKLIQAVVETDVQDIRELDPGIDPELARIVAKMLNKDPDQRYQNMHELIVDLDKHPLLVQGGPIEVSVPPARVAPSTMIGVPMSMTPGGGSRLTPGGSRVSTPPPDMSRRTPPNTPQMPARATPAPAKPMFAEAAPVGPAAEKKSWWPVLTMSVLMFLAGATLALHGQIFGTGATETPTSVAGAPSAEAVAEQAQKDRTLAYYEAGIVALFGLAMTGYWFGIYSRRKRESEVGIHSLANMKWRECIGLVLEAMRRDGYEEAPSSKQPGDGGTDFLLMHDGEPVLLGYKHGTAYRIGDANVRDFAHAVQMQGAKAGILVTLGLAETSARDLAKRYDTQIIDGGALWPKVRPFVSPNTLDHVRLQTAAQTWRGIWIGAACSLVFGAGTFLVADLTSPEQKSALVAKVTATPPPPVVPTTASASADRALQQINDTAQAMAAVAKLTDAQLAQRRVDAAKQVSSIVQVSSAGWPSESTLLLSLKQTDGVDKDLIDEVCRILTQYEELRYTRLQLQPPASSNAPVRWRQCQ